jgi:small subunit ribosomal protein S11
MGQQKITDKTKMEELLEEKIEESKKQSKKQEEKKKLKKARKKKKPLIMIKRGRAYIQATYNNIIVTITDLRGDTLAWSSAGLMGFKGPKKSTPYAAGVTVGDIAAKTKERGLQEVDVLVKGVGPGREAAIRAFNTNNIQIISIKDITSIPHNGCRPPKPRRV